MKTQPTTTQCSARPTPVEAAFVVLTSAVLTAVAFLCGLCAHALVHTSNPVQDAMAVAAPAAVATPFVLLVLYRAGAQVRGRAR